MADRRLGIGKHVKTSFAAKAIEVARHAAAGSAVLLLAAAPAAAAEQPRTSLSVTATVAPACKIDGDAVERPSIACSTGATHSTMTAARADEQPLHEAAAMLGAPMRRDGGGIVFTAPVRAASTVDTGSVEAGARYLTVTY